MASIRKRINGKYQATIYLGKDETGKTICKYITRDTLKECRKAAYEFEVKHKTS